MLAIPVFILVTAALAAVVDLSDRPAWQWARDFLLLQFAFLAAALATALATDDAVVVALLAVAAMATQNALLHLTLRSAPSTAVMTGNTVAATIALVGLAVHRGEPRASEPDRAAWNHLWPLLLGFGLGCLVGAGSSGALGEWAWLLPALLSAVLAFTVTVFGLPAPMRREA